MRISPPLKAVIVAVPAGAWLAHSHPSLGRTLAFAAGAAFLTFAWIVFSPPPPAAPAIEAADGCRSVEQRRRAAPHGVSRTPTGRDARDVRCPASRATAPARRSTRR